MLIVEEWSRSGGRHLGLEDKKRGWDKAGEARSSGRLIIENMKCYIIETKREKSSRLECDSRRHVAKPLEDFIGNGKENTNGKLQKLWFGLDFGLEKF